MCCIKVHNSNIDSSHVCALDDAPWSVEWDYNGKVFASVMASSKVTIEKLFLALVKVLINCWRNVLTKFK